MMDKVRAGDDVSGGDCSCVARAPFLCHACGEGFVAAAPFCVACQSGEDVTAAEECPGCDKVVRIGTVACDDCLAEPAPCDYCGRTTPGYTAHAHCREDDR